MKARFKRSPLNVHRDEAILLHSPKSVLHLASHPIKRCNEMAEMSIQDLAKKVADIDFTMLSTRASGGEIAARPMSNNGDVEYDGDSWFFAWEDSRIVDDIKRDPQVGLSLQGKSSLLGKPPIFISIEATAELIRDKPTLAEHWQSELSRWFEQGTDTPGIILIKAHANRIHYWDGEDEGEVKV
jgi:general stress protein 26